MQRNIPLRRIDEKIEEYFEVAEDNFKAVPATTIY